MVAMTTIIVIRTYIHDNYQHLGIKG